MYIGPSGSYGWFDQNDSSDFPRLLSNPTTMASGQWLDACYDWNREGGDHFDARVSRSCKSGYQRDSGNTYETTNLSGANKRGSCYGPDDVTTSGTCNVFVGSLSSVVPNIPNPCTRAWELSSSGTVLYHSGGSSTSCTA